MLSKLIDQILGKKEIVDFKINTEIIMISFPDRIYTGIANQYVHIEKRPRWFTNKITRTQIKIPEGVIINKHGDKLYALSFPLKDIKAAISMFKKTVYSYNMEMGHERIKKK